MSVFLGHKYGWVPLNILPKIALNYNLVENSIGFEYKGAEGKGKTEGFRFLVDNELPSFGREDQQLMSTKQKRHKCGPTVGRAVFATPAPSFLFCSGVALSLRGMPSTPQADVSMWSPFPTFMIFWESIRWSFIWWEAPKHPRGRVAGKCVWFLAGPELGSD